MGTESQLRRTPLFETHAKAGAKLVPFAGWEMPVEYEGLTAEHKAVRTGSGMFDVSHMGQVFLRGPDAFTLLQKVVSNDVEKLAISGAQYSVICNENGGVIDDVFCYRLERDLFLIITNAANHSRDHEWFKQHSEGMDVSVEDQFEHFAMIAVQGPRAREAVQALADHPLPGRHQILPRTLRGYPCLIAGTGYTGEDGVEILLQPSAAADIWGQLAARGVKPIGLGARDTLRLEACYHLYGNDLSEDRGPIGAGLGWACKEATGFIGSEAVAAERVSAPAEKLVPFKFVDKGIPRPGNPVVGGGVVTSGTYSPMLELGIGLAYIPVSQAEVGNKFQVDVRGRTREAEVASRPLYASPGQ